MNKKEEEIKKHFRIKKERIALIQLFENLTFDEKKQN